MVLLLSFSHAFELHVVFFLDERQRCFIIMTLRNISPEPLFTTGIVSQMPLYWILSAPATLDYLVHCLGVSRRTIKPVFEYSRCK